MARGNASKVFQPFVSPRDFEGSLEGLKNKLLVNFDPLRCFVGDLKASIFHWFDVNLEIIALLIIYKFFLTHAERVFQHLQGVV